MSPTEYTLEDISKLFPTVGKFNNALLSVAPSHRNFLSKRFARLSKYEVRNIEQIAVKISDLVGDDLETYTIDYNWLCERQLEEELYFRRNNRYRLTTSHQAYEEVYSDVEYMSKYMNGLLLTQIWWSNHTQMLSFYKEDFLAKNPARSSHLEVGPGHGLLLHYACESDNLDEISAWDISPASITSTENALKKMGTDKTPNLSLMDLFNAGSGARFDSIVFSEVLEHMETPELAMQALRAILKKDGRLFVHIPINSPAPDHLFNVETPSLMAEFVQDQGFKIETRFFSPMTNCSLGKAIERRYTVSCGFICRKRYNPA